MRERRQKCLGSSKNGSVSIITPFQHYNENTGNSKSLDPAAI